MKGALAGGGQLSNIIGVLAGAPATLRAYAPLSLRAASRHPLRTHQQRIGLAVAEHQGSGYALATLQRTARDAGLGIDEVALAREFDSRDECEAALLRYVRALLESDGPPPLHLHEEAREAGWEDEQILEAVAHVALNSFANLVTRAGDVPKDGSAEEARLLQAASALGSWVSTTPSSARDPGLRRSGGRVPYRCAHGRRDAGGQPVLPWRRTGRRSRSPRLLLLYHRAVELIGKRWSGAILLVLMDGPLRFSQIKCLVPDLSDRLLSERLKELEGEGIVARYEEDGASCRVQYGLTAKGRALEPAVRALKTWANTHL